MTRTELIKLAASSAANMLLSLRPENTIEEKEGHLNFSTIGDRESEKAIISLIHLNYPEDAILSEETHHSLSIEEIRLAPNIWIIDPLDGTADYRYGRKHVSVSIAYAQFGAVKSGIVINPFTKDEYYAEEGFGAYWNGKKISIGTTTDISNATLLSGNSYDPQVTHEHLSDFLKISPTPWIQINGSAAQEICEVAARQADLFFSYYLEPWDCAAASLILQEAGGVIKNRNGEVVDFLSHEFIAGSQLLVDSFLSITRSHR